MKWIIILIINLLILCNPVLSFSAEEFETNDTLKINTLIDSTIKYRYDNEKIAHQYATQAIELSNQINYEKGLANGKYQLALITSDFDLKQAGIILLQSLEHAEFVSDSILIGKIYNIMGNHKMQESMYRDAIEYYQSSLEISLGYNQNNYAAIIYNNIAGAYYYLQEDSLSIHFALKAIELVEKTNDYYMVSTSYINLALLYIQFKEMALAEDFLEKSIGVKKEHSFKAEELLRFKHSYNRAYSEYFYQKNDYLEALKYADSSLILANELGDLFLKQRNLETLKDIYFKLNRPLEESQILRQLVIINDSVNRFNRSKELDLFGLQYEFEKKQKEQELKTTKLKAEFHRKENTYLISILLAVLAIFTFLFLHIRLRNKNQRKTLEQKNTLLEKEKLHLEKEKLSADLHFKNKELTSSVMYLLQKNEFISSISGRLKDAYVTDGDLKKKRLDEIILELERNTKNENWDDFELRFQEVHADFYKKLYKSFPDLTPNDLRLCAFLHLNMTTKEIANITFQSPDSLKKARYRLRKKLNLKREDNLVAFLSKI